MTVQRFRTLPQAGDVAAIRELVAAAAVFYPEEGDVALELLEERLRLGEASGYDFIFADVGTRLIGYTAFGRVPLTQASYDLYWIVVHPEYQGRGIGRRLLELTEIAVAERGGGRLYIETSSRDEYRRTRDFYRHAAYAEVASLAHFYAEGDAKVVFCKALAGIDRMPKVRLN